MEDILQKIREAKAASHIGEKAKIVFDRFIHIPSTHSRGNSYGNWPYLWGIITRVENGVVWFVAEVGNDNCNISIRIEYIDSVIPVNWSDDIGVRYIDGVIVWRTDAKVTRIDLTEDEQMIQSGV